MTDPLTPVEPEHISCEICLKEIPESEAMSHEAEEYVIHFCGIECYSQWHKENPPEKAEES